MIVAMTRIRVLGPAAALGATVRALQDEGVVHVVDAEPAGSLVHPVEAARERRRRKHLARALAEVDAAIEGLAKLGAAVTGEASGLLIIPIDSSGFLKNRRETSLLIAVASGNSSRKKSCGTFINPPVGLSFLNLMLRDIWHRVRHHLPVIIQ